MLLKEDAQWVDRLTGPDKEAAIKELQGLLHKALFSFELRYEDKEDFVQAALITILQKLNTFQRKSKFTTWAIAIAINTALSELRKRHWKNVSIEDLTTMDIANDINAKDDPQLNFQRQWALGLIDSLIQSELTLKQRTALLAELNGMPLQEIATRMNVSRGAIYKLTFDARKKLILCLKQKNLSLDELLSAME